MKKQKQQQQQQKTQKPWNTAPQAVRIYVHNQDLNTLVLIYDFAF